MQISKEQRFEILTTIYTTMKTLLNRWNTIWLRPLTDEEALKVLDGYNKTRYSRRKNKEGLLELASREAHEQQEVYFATILNEDDSPYCAIESNVGYFWGGLLERGGS